MAAAVAAARARARLHVCTHTHLVRSACIPNDQPRTQLHRRHSTRTGEALGKVFASAAIFPSTQKLLESHFDIVVARQLPVTSPANAGADAGAGTHACTVIGHDAALTDPLPRDEWLAGMDSAAGFLAFMPDQISRADLCLGELSDLRAISCVLRGRDNFCVDAIREQGIEFFTCEDLLTEPTAELAIALALGQ